MPAHTDPNLHEISQFRHQKHLGFFWKLTHFGTLRASPAIPHRCRPEMFPIFTQISQFWREFGTGKLLRNDEGKIDRFPRINKFKFGFSPTYEISCPSPDLIHLIRSLRIADSSRLYRLGVSEAQKAKYSGDERPRLRTSSSVSPTLSGVHCVATDTM